MSKELSSAKRITDVIEEYNRKLDEVHDLVKRSIEFENEVDKASTVSGTYAGRVYDKLYLSESTIKANLLQSAWKHIWNVQFKSIASAKDKKNFEYFLQKPLPLTIQSIKDKFGDYILDPRATVLRSLAETFQNLDPAYKSHEKVKIGVKGLPKRVIITSCDSIWGYGPDQLYDIIKSIRTYEGGSFLEKKEFNDFFEHYGKGKELNGEDHSVALELVEHLELKLYQNGNGHLIFSPSKLRSINLALHEFYGDILPDTRVDDNLKKRESTEVSKDLQYYHTPDKVIEKILNDLPIHDGDMILEPSCGDGRILDMIADKFNVESYGIEFHHKRCQQAREKGHGVLHANFLEVEPDPIYDYVIMNPPFYGYHYIKHLRHARKFLKKNGKLTCILPATAYYDHGLLPKGGTWRDLPLRSFSEAGTNVNTGYYELWREER